MDATAIKYTVHMNINLIELFNCMTIYRLIYRLYTFLKLAVGRSGENVNMNKQNKEEKKTVTID